MKKSYLTLEERYQIKSLLHQENTSAEIARKLNRSASVIKKEIRLAGKRESYDPDKANQEAKIRIQRNGRPARKIELDEAAKQIIAEATSKGLSKHKIRDLVGIGHIKLRRYLNEKYPGYKSLYGKNTLDQEKRISALEMQIEILIEQIRRLNDKFK